jgi:uncharacterized protein (DUF885 family)
LSYCDGIHLDFEQLISWMRFEAVDDYRKYINRLSALPHRVETDIHLLQHAVSTGCTHSIYSVEAVPEQLRHLTDVSPEDSVFFKPFKSPPSCVDGDVFKAMMQEAVDIINCQVQPAFRQLHIYIEQVYLQSCRPREGVDSIPGGKEFYSQCLKWHTSLDVTPHQVHDLGLAEVKRIRKEMQRVIKKTGFTGEFSDFIKYVQTDGRFCYNSKEECLNAFRRACYDVIHPKLSTLFSKIPQSKLIIESAPESKSSGSAAYYLAGTLDGTRPGIVYINCSNIKHFANYDLISLCLHEGEPGHHFQGMYAVESTEVPRFRRYFEDMYYSQAPSKFPFHTAYCEGWGLYCEYLGYELGLYEDPMTEFGYLSMEMFRACRLVADTGLHAFGWTYEQALKLFTDNVAYYEADLRNEIRRYITWPGQACAYKVGELKIKELRQKVTTTLGSEFDIRSFHDLLLHCGLVPLTVLEQVVQCYLDSHL